MRFWFGWLIGLIWLVLLWHRLFAQKLVCWLCVSAVWRWSKPTSRLPRRLRCTRRRAIFPRASISEHCTASEPCIAFHCCSMARQLKDTIYLSMINNIPQYSSFQDALVTLAAQLSTSLEYRHDNPGQLWVETELMWTQSAAQTLDGIAYFIYSVGLWSTY